MSYRKEHFNNVDRSKFLKAIAAEGVVVDERLRPQLGPPAGPRGFGADNADPEFCPPELSEVEDLVLGENIDSATVSLTL